jgi:hypothetical protein
MKVWVAERLSVVVEICFFLPFLLSPKKGYLRAALQSISVKDFEIS